MFLLFGWLAFLIVGLLGFSLFYLERLRGRRLRYRIFELEKLSQQVLNANKGKSEFLANVSHEFRTPLNTIIGFTDLLKEGYYGELASSQLTALSRIESSSNHLRQIIDQVLDLAKINAGRYPLNVESINIRTFLLDIATEIEPLAMEKKCSIHLSLRTAGAAMVHTDPAHLRQIVVNLLGNAIKYSQSEMISIKTQIITKNLKNIPEILRKSPNDWLVIQIVDYGIGISPDFHNRIFEGFFQVPSGVTKDNPAVSRSLTNGVGYFFEERRGSTGLGLSIARQLSHLINGEIFLESSVGKGSTFSIWLPNT